MANLALLEDPQEMRATASSVNTLKEDFESLRNRLQKAISEELNTACAGDIADEFTRYYNENINTKLVDERERLNGVVTFLKTNADRLDATNAAVKSSFKA